MATIDQAMAMWRGASWPPPAAGGIVWETVYTDGTVAVTGDKLDIGVTNTVGYETDIQVSDDPGGSLATLDFTGCTCEFGVTLKDVVSTNLLSGHALEVVTSFKGGSAFLWRFAETNIGDVDTIGNTVAAGDFIFQCRGPWEATNIATLGLVYHPGDHWTIRIQHNAGTSRYALYINDVYIDDGPDSGSVAPATARIAITVDGGWDRAPWEAEFDWGASGVYTIARIG